MTDAAGLVSLDEDSYYQDLQGFFAWLRESRPVAPVRMPAYGRAWVVTRYEDVRAVLADSRMAKDVHQWPGGGRSRPSEATGVCAHMLHADPPEHTRLRRLVQKPFASRRAALRKRTEEIAAALLGELARCGGDTADLLGQYARSAVATHRPDRTVIRPRRLFRKERGCPRQLRAAARRSGGARGRGSEGPSNRPMLMGQNWWQADRGIW